MKTFLVFLILFLFLTNPSFSEEKLTLGIHPYLPIKKIIERFTPLKKYLEEQTGGKITIHVAKSYKQHIENIGNNKLDFAWMGPASYVSLTKQYGAKPLLVRIMLKGKPFYHSIIITRKNSGINKISELKNKTFAFGDPDSTMGYYVPRYTLEENGIQLEDFKKHENLKTHHDVALAVLTGVYDAGGIKEAVFNHYENRGLKELFKSIAISEHLLITRSDLPAPMIEKLKNAFLNLNNDPKHQNILTAIKKEATGFAPVKDQDYENLRNIFKSFNQ